MPISTTPEWRFLESHYLTIAKQSIREGVPTLRLLTVGPLTLDYSRHRITDETLTMLIALATKVDVHARAAEQVQGDIINVTEQRAVLHTALRANQTDIGDERIAADIASTKIKMAAFCDDIYNDKLVGSTGKSFKHIVNIGIGGSHTGPLMTVEALKDYAINSLQFYFVSTIDPALLNDVLAQVDPETTLFLISSKSFSTIETKTNADRARQWLQDNLGEQAVADHVIAMTANVERAVEFGIRHDRILPLWDWVGGRYSIWSAIGLPLMLMIGPKQFDEFLAGAQLMDKHYVEAPYKDNMPVIMALLSVWYTNFFKTTSQAIIPYAYRLRTLITYLQQAIMESNGKSVTKDGTASIIPTSPVIFGQEGCEGQHTYHQLLHQGTQLIPADMIIVKEAFHKSDQPYQDIAVASAMSQAEALRIGKSEESAHEEAIKRLPAAEATTLVKHLAIEGNKPTSLIIMNKLTPQSLGSLLSLYEHLIAVQGMIWDIHPYDQWGVELGKALLPTMLNNIQRDRMQGGNAL